MKAIINSVTPKTWQDKTFQEVVYNGNQTGASWKDDFAPLVNQTVDIDVKVTKSGKNSLSLVAGAVPSSAPAAPPKQSSAPVSDHFDFDVRKTSLLIALEKFEKTNKTIEGEGFWPEVKSIEAFLRDGTVPDKK